MARTSLRAVIALIALIALVPLARAQEAAPEPSSCAGLSFEDPAGDAYALRPVTAAPGVPGSDNLDVVGGFLRYVPDASGTNLLTANIEVADLTKDLEPWATSSVWFFRFNVGTVTHYLSAEVDADGNEAYTYGTASGSQLSEEGETKGRFFEGKEGSSRSTCR